jgi:MFS family permease
MDNRAVATSRNHAPLYALYGANTVSMIGNQLSNLAIPWFVLQTTGSATQTGITAFFSILPTVLSAFFGGGFVDRLGFRRTSIIADLASGVTVALIPLLYAFGFLEFWLLLVLVFFGAVLDAPGATARQSLLPDLATLAGMRLERASANTQVVERSSLLIGSPLAGVLIAVLGATNVLWLNAASFAVSAALVAIRIPAFPRPKEDGPARSYLSEMRKGFGFIRRDRLLRALVITLMVTNLLDAAKTSVVFPVLADDVFNSAVALGLIFGVSGGGAVIGALIYGWIGHRLPRRPVFVFSFIMLALPSLLLVALPPLWVVLLIQGISGVAAGPLNPVLATLRYERVPAAMRGRVFGMTTAGAYAAMPLGVLIAGVALDRFGLRATFLAVGICYVVTTLTLVINPAIQEMDSVVSPVDPS